MSPENKAVKIGIMPYKRFKARTIAIAKGSLKPKKDDPKIWFPSMKSLANVLSEDNQKLLKLIMEMKPQSISELEPLTGRKANNLLRILRILESYGFVKLKQGKPGKGRTPLVPEVNFKTAKLEIELFS